MIWRTITYLFIFYILYSLVRIFYVTTISYPDDFRCWKNCQVAGDLKSINAHVTMQFKVFPIGIATLCYINVCPFLHSGNT